MPLLIAKTKGIDILFAYLFEYINQAVLVWCICIHKQAQQGPNKVRGGSHQVGSDRYLSSVENPGWLFDIGDYTTQLYRDYNKPI